MSTLSTVGLIFTSCQTYLPRLVPDFFSLLKASLFLTSLRTPIQNALLVKLLPRMFVVNSFSCADRLVCLVEL